MAQNNALRWDAMDKNGVRLDKMFRQFEAFNRSEGKTEGTVFWYNNALELFVRFLESHDTEPILGNLTAETVREYILYLQKRNRFSDHPFMPDQQDLLSPTTIKCYVRAIKGFCSWLYAEEYTLENRLAKVWEPKAPNKLVEPLTEDEIALILAHLDPNALWGARQLAIVVLLLDTGLRLSEMCNLSLQDLHLEDGYVKVMGKGGKERLVPFGSKAQKALMKWVYHFRPEPLGADNVFLNFDGSPVLASGMRVMFRRMAEASGVTRLHAHLLRHTYAVSYLDSGGDVFALQQNLGHTTLEMTRRYVHLNKARVLREHRVSPVDHMNLRQIKRAVAYPRKRRSASAGRRAI